MMNTMNIMNVTAKIPGVREPKRLFVVGWEVNTQFGKNQYHQPENG
jgi:hypothetical protein